MPEMPSIGPDREALPRLVIALVDEMDDVHQRMVRIAGLVEALLDEGDTTILDERNRRALLALRGVAAAYARAYDATRGDAAAARGDPAGPDPSV